jgi:hypothetical protein
MYSKPRFEWRLIIIFILFSVVFGVATECKAQNYDSLKSKILDMDYELKRAYRTMNRDRKYAASADSVFRVRLDDFQGVQEQIQMNLYNSHKEFRTGTILSITGFLVSMIGVATIPNKASFAISGVGSVLMITGSIFMIDSHKFIGRASGRSFKK